GDGALDSFARFCERAARELAPVVGRACTINEPNIVAVMGHLMGMFPPGATDLDETKRVIDALRRAHRVAVDAIRTGAPGVPVRLTLSMTEYQAVEGGEAMLEQPGAMMEDTFLDATAGDDFVGVQCYSRMRLGPQGPLGPEDGVTVLPMGYEYWPQALGAT